MQKAEYTSENRKLFNEKRYSHPDKRVMRRFEILWLHSCGKYAAEISQLVGLSVNTVRDAINMFKKGGVELVETMGSNHPKSGLDAHKDLILADFLRRPPASSNEASARIEKLTGIKRSSRSVCVFMGRLGLKRRKTGAVPAKADPAKQDEFKKKRWSLK